MPGTRNILLCNIFGCPHLWRKGWLSISSGNMDLVAVSPNIYLKSNMNVMSSEFKSGIGIGIRSSADDHSVTRNFPGGSSRLS
jgi:hypothetical protein